jgi:hypothetical protein
MKKLNLVALLLGAALFLGFGVTTASAEMKCGAGKCGSSMSEKSPQSCANKNCECGENCNCGTTCKCGETKPSKEAMKCGSGKCGTK